MSDLEDSETYRNRAVELRTMAPDFDLENRVALLRAADAYDALAELAERQGKELTGT